MVNKALDFDVILDKYGIESAAPTVALKKIADICTNLENTEKIEFYAYLLEHINSTELLAGILKLTANYIDSKLLPLYLDILLLKNDDEKSQDDFINAKVLCAKNIAAYKDTMSVNTLLYCLNNKDEHYKVRLACADALGRIGSKYAVKSLIDVVQDKEEKSVYVQESATFALGLLGDMSAVEPLISIMEAKQGVLGKFSFLKEKIIEALGKLNPGNAKVLQVLKNALFDSSAMVRINAIEAIMNSDSEQAADIIREALNDEDNEVKRNALIALYNILGRDILDEVISLPGYSEFLKIEAKALLEEYEED